MKFFLFCFAHKAPIFIAAEKGYIEMIKLLLTNQDLDINIKSTINK